MTDFHEQNQALALVERAQTAPDLRAIFKNSGMQRAAGECGLAALWRRAGWKLRHGPRYFTGITVPAGARYKQPGPLQIGNPPWLNIGSAGWVNIQSARTA
jgi:hypothetical protein